MILTLHQVFWNERQVGGASRLLETDLCIGKACVSHRQTVLSSQFVFACYVAKYLVRMLFSVDMFSMLHVSWRFAGIGGLDDTSATPIAQQTSTGLVDGKQSVLCACCAISYSACIPSLALKPICAASTIISQVQPRDASQSAVLQSFSPTILPAIQAFKQSQLKTIPAAYLLRMLSNHSSGDGRIDLGSKADQQSRSTSTVNWVAGPIHSSSCHTESVGFQRRAVFDTRPQSPSRSPSASIIIHGHPDPVDLACCVGCVESSWSRPSASYQSPPATLPSSLHAPEFSPANSVPFMVHSPVPKSTANAFAADSSNRRFADMLAVNHEVVL